MQVDKMIFIPSVIFIPGKNTGYIKGENLSELEFIWMQVQKEHEIVSRKPDKSNSNHNGFDKVQSLIDGRIDNNLFTNVDRENNTGK